jgi:AraC-like DNA-binding protein
MPPRHSSEAAPSFVSQQVLSARRFYLNLKPRSVAGIVAVCGGLEKCAQEYAIDRPTFPYLSIEFVVSGQGKLVLDGKPHELSAGSLFAYGPRIPHVIRTSAAAPLVKYFVDFLGTDARRQMQAIGLAPGKFSLVNGIADVRSSFDTLISLGLRRDRYTERMCALQLELLMHTIARSKAALSANERRARMTFERCRSFIDESFLSIAFVDDFAQACAIDSSHLCRLFRRFQRESPLQYLQRRRMQWAADRLQNSDVLVREVADELQTDPYQFSRTFKRIHGVSPMAFLTSRPTAARTHAAEPTKRA